ncbi:SH3 domain-containing protein [Brucella sp. 2716]|uniref:SH3 domain-containing protein n=1 Tax=Brucella sp. 2716 TaxID=2975052 RepID=UPI00217E72AA|nr:SH3 domain-containing protein [Brucella sp. 2716]UWF59009.1 SH3 domain-containing protein [Brucella sp. 2716]
MSLFKGMLANNRFLGAAVLAAAVFIPAIASAAPAVVSASVNVRSGPGAHFTRLAAIPAWTRVNAGPCRNGWCRIGNGSRYGWISARYVRFAGYAGGYAAQPPATVIVNNGGYDDWGPALGWGLGIGWASSNWGPYWGPGWGGYRGGPNYIHGCIGRNCQSGWGPGRRGWNPHWGRGPQRRAQWGRGWPQHVNRPFWGPGPAMGPRFGGVGHGFGGGYRGMHLGNMRSLHAGR